MKHRYYIGIDPDIDRSGVAVWDSQEKEFYFLNTLDFFPLFHFLYNEFHPIHQNKCALLRIEAGFLNKSNWHGGAKFSGSANTEIGRRTGINHATAMLIEKMAKDIGIDYELVKPTKSKVNDANYFKKLTGYTKQTNQEKRDAAMLVYGL